MSIVNEPNHDPKSMIPPPGKPDRTLRPRRWWPRWLFRLVVVIVAGVFALFWYFAHLRREAVAEVRAAVAELDRTEPGWRLQELEAARAVIPEKENSAVVVAEAYRWLPQGWPSREFGDRSVNLSPQEQLDAEDIACLRIELAETQVALLEARKLANLPNGRYRITYNRNMVDTLLPHVNSTRSVYFLLRMDVLAQAQDGDLNGALRSCRALLNAARALGDEPLLVTQLVRMAGVAVTCQAVERVLAQGEADPGDLLELQRLLEEEERFPRLLVGVRGERGGMHEFFDAIECGNASLNDMSGARPSWSDGFTGFAERNYIRGQHPSFLALANEWVRIAALPAHERGPAWELLDANSRSQPSILARLVLPGLTKFDQAARRADGDLRCVVTALAAEHYRRLHGRWPDNLQQLVPEFLPAVLLDPEDGEPLRFHRRPDRVVIYSTMKIQRSGAGPESYDPDEPSPPGVGVAIHLFDVQHRRQPPRPRPVTVDDPQ